MFTRAITRKPCRALINGIATAQFGEGTPDYDKAIAQHDVYCETLRSLGLEVLELPGDERFLKIFRFQRHFKIAPKPLETGFFQ